MFSETELPAYRIRGNSDGVRAEPPRTPALSSHGITRFSSVVRRAKVDGIIPIRVSPLGKWVGKKEEE